LATVGVAVQQRDDGIRIAVSAAAPTPVRAKTVERAVNGGMTDWHAAAALVKDDIIPITDLRGSREYRCHLAEALIRRGLAEIMEV
jgi:carbon-monoxide dehydrogenase medium subunit